MVMYTLQLAACCPMLHAYTHIRFPNAAAASLLCGAQSGLAWAACRCRGGCASILAGLGHHDLDQVVFQPQQAPHPVPPHILQQASCAELKQS